MLKKIISSVLIVAILSVVPAMMIGCEQNEYKRTTSYQEDNRPVKQKTVVE